MSGQERTRPLPESERFTPDWGLTPDGHSRQPETVAAAREKLVSKAAAEAARNKLASEVGQMLSPATLFCEEFLVDVKQDRQTKDAAATLASLYVSAQVLQGDLTVVRTPSGAVSDNLAMADRTTEQPVAAF